VADGCVFGRRGTGFSGYSDGKEKLDARLAKSGLHIPPCRVSRLVLRWRTGSSSK